jgi:hypothetical protein
MSKLRGKPTWVMFSKRPIWYKVDVFGSFKERETEAQGTQEKISIFHINNSCSELHYTLAQ